MFCTIKGPTRKTVHGRPSDWNPAVPRVLYGDRRRRLVTRFSPFQLLCEVSPQMLFDHFSQYIAERPASERRTAKVLDLASYLATHSDKTSSSFCQVSASKEFKEGDSVPVARGTALSFVIRKPPFSSKFYRPCVIAMASHSRYKL